MPTLMVVGTTGLSTVTLTEANLSRSAGAAVRDLLAPRLKCG